MIRYRLNETSPAIVLDNVKDAEIRFRIPRWLKDDFYQYCEAQDVPAAQILRQSIRRILKEESRRSR